MHLSPEDTRRLLIDLEPVAAAELDRHLAAAKEWFPHEYVPWSEGRDLRRAARRRAVVAGESTIPDEARTSLIVNLLTEDNLPQLPPRDRRQLRPRRRLGDLGAPLDRRGGPARPASCATTSP